MKKDINKFRNKNKFISCECGCGNKLLKYDKYGRVRKFILGHHNRLMSNKERIRRSKMISGNKNPAKRPEVRIKISKNRSGIPLSEKEILRLKKMNIGKKLKEEHKRKISESEKGRIFPREVLDKRSGENHYRWLGGKSFEPYSIDFNNKLKRKIRKRDNQVCMNCGIHREKLNNAFDVHHINYDKKGSIKENLISLCHSCHSLTNINREYWTNIFQLKLSNIYGYKYSNNNEIILEIKNEI